MRSSFHALMSVVSDRASVGDSDVALVYLPTSFRCADAQGDGFGEGVDGDGGSGGGLFPMSRSVQRAVHLLCQASSPAPTSASRAPKTDVDDGDGEVISSLAPSAFPLPPRVRCVGGSWRSSRIPNRIRDALLTVQVRYDTSTSNLNFRRVKFSYE